MDLTPEERRRIYEEEKARLEAGTDIEKPAEEPEVIEPEERLSPAPFVVIILFGVAVVIAYSLFGGQPKTGKVNLLTDTTAAAIEAARRSYDLSTPARPRKPSVDREKLAMADDLVRNLLAQGVLSEVYSKDNVRVVVGQSFYAFPFDSKVGVCTAISFVSRASVLFLTLEQLMTRLTRARHENRLERALQQHVYRAGREPGPGTPPRTRAPTRRF